MMATALLTSVMMLACGSPQARFATSETAGNFQERDEINRTYQLNPGARVEISSIRGPVEITNGAGATAEVQIIRTARTRADLEYHKIEVEQTPQGLVVKGVQEQDRRRQNIQVSHHVILKLPRQIALTVSSISGPVKTGDVDGLLNLSSVSGPATVGYVGGKLTVSSISGSLAVGDVGSDASVNSISGNLRLGQVNGRLDVASVSGELTATVVRLAPQGIHLKSISGSVELRFKDEVNADFKSEDVSGQVYFDVPNVNVQEGSKSSNVRAQIGAGGSPISISSVSGNIRLKRTS